MLPRAKSKQLDRIRKLSGINESAVPGAASADWSNRLNELSEDPVVNFTIDEDMQTFTEVVLFSDVPDDFFQGGQTVQLDQLSATIDQLAKQQLEAHMGDHSAEHHEIVRVRKGLVQFKKKVQEVIQALGEVEGNTAYVNVWGEEYDANIGVYLHVEW